MPIRSSEFALSTAQRSPIAPIVPPLSKNKNQNRRSLDTTLNKQSIKIIAASAVIMTVMALIILQFARLFEPATNIEVVQPTSITTAAVTVQTEARAPFETLSIAQAKEAAETELARFVELQLKLEAEFNVQAWGMEEVSNAKDKALKGDSYFLDEDFEQAIFIYASAANVLAVLIEEAKNRFSQYRSEAEQNILALNEVVAGKALSAAQEIKPQDEELAVLQQRIVQLPQIKNLLLSARNLELRADYFAALNVYQRIREMDAYIPNISDSIAAATQAEQRQSIKRFLSQGFKHLELGDFSGAKLAFEETLQIDSENEIALGGLEQVSQRHEIAIILKNDRDALNYLQNEQWAEALAAYEAILNLDVNILLAKTGKDIARAHAQAEAVLKRISDQPSKLSDINLFNQANVLVEEAKALKYVGPKLTILLQSVEATLNIYRSPVSVTLISDNSINVIVSNIGELGSFATRALELRPGEYTIRASANGCRDIYFTVTVVPDLDPIEVRCREVFR